MAQTKDYYAVLGVASTATAADIKKQYRRLAKQYHPDANASDPKAAERFKEISEANNVLGDVEKRKQYDDMRRLGAFGGFGGGRTGASPSRGSSSGGASRAGAPGEQNFRFEDFDVGGIGGLGDIFSSMFGGGAAGARQGQRPRAPEAGQSIETTLEVPFRTAASGGKIPVELEVNEECGTCHGSGAAAGATIRTCPECSGRGTISFGQGGFAVSRPCPMCLGRGSVPSAPCATCHGAGELRNRRKILISVPAGVDTGARVRLKGQGGKGLRGGPPGDLLITFQVQPDRLFAREGVDIVVHAPINVVQATLGTRVSVPTLDDKKVSVKVPPGTQPGKRFRVRGLGIEKDASKGDLVVEIVVTIPEKLDENAERLMKEFAASSGLSV